MTNGSLIRMSNGEKIRRFWVFTDGEVIEYTKNGRVKVEDLRNYLLIYYPLDMLKFNRVA